VVCYFGPNVVEELFRVVEDLPDGVPDDVAVVSLLSLNRFEVLFYCRVSCYDFSEWRLGVSRDYGLTGNGLA